MKWYYIVLIVSAIIAPFDAFYMYIKSEKRRDALKKRKRESKGEQHRNGNEQ